MGLSPAQKQELWRGLLLLFEDNPARPAAYPKQKNYYNDCILSIFCIFVDRRSVRHITVRSRFIIGFGNGTQSVVENRFSILLGGSRLDTFSFLPISGIEYTLTVYVPVCSIG